MPDAAGLELILAEINRETPGAVLDTNYDRGQAALVIDPDHVLAVLAWLRDTPGQEYTFLSALLAADYLPAHPRFAVHYELLNRERYERIRVKALLADPAAAARSNGEVFQSNGGPAGAADLLPEIDSCVELFPTADFQEREAFDFFGIVFRGHPDLRRILMPEDYEGHPQRRDFPIGGEPVIFTRDEVSNPGWWQ